MDWTISTIGNFLGCLSEVAKSITCVICRLDYQSGHLDSYDDTIKLGKEGKRNDGLRDWPSMVSNGSPKHSPKR